MLGTEGGWQSGIAWVGVSVERPSKATRQDKEVQINQRNTDFLKHAGQSLSPKKWQHHRIALAVSTHWQSDIFE